MNGRIAVALLAMALIAPARAAGAPLTEGVLEVHAEAIVRGNGTVTVEETILVLAAGKRIAHGVSQDIPTRTRDRLGERHDFDLEIAGVTRDGQPEAFAVEDVAGAKRVRIGDPRVPLPPGTHVYVVSYRTENQVGFLGDHDQLDWNVTGDVGGLPVEQASAVVSLPVGAARAMGALDGFIGTPGAPAAGGARSVVADRRGLAAVFTGKRRLAPHEALTAVVTWPNGFVAKPGFAARAVRLGRDNRALLAALVALLLQLAGLRAARGAARPAPATAPAPATPTPNALAGVAPAAPDGLSPAALRFAVGDGADDIGLVAALLRMAGQRAIAITPGAGSGLIVTRAGIPTAMGTATAPAEAAPEERAAIEALFAGGDAVPIGGAGAGALAAARRALGEACAARVGERYFFRRSHHAVPGLLLSAAALAALAASARGTHARALAAALALLLPPWTAAAAGLVAGCARLWRRRARGARPTARFTGRALASSGLALLVVAAELAGLRAFASLTSLPAAGLLLATTAIDVSLLRLPPIATGAGRALLDGAAAYRALLRASERLPDEHVPYAVALGVAAPAGSLAARLTAAVQASASQSPPPPEPPRPSSSSSEHIASTSSE